jgi:hypothetical protein
MFGKCEIASHPSSLSLFYNRAVNEIAPDIRRDVKVGRANST